jgi:hypothetical protein
MLSSRLASSKRAAEQSKVKYGYELSPLRSLFETVDVRAPIAAQHLRLTTRLPLVLAV